MCLDAVHSNVSVIEIVIESVIIEKCSHIPRQHRVDLSRHIRWCHWWSPSLLTVVWQMFHMFCPCQPSSKAPLWIPSHSAAMTQNLPALQFIRIYKDRPVSLFMPGCLRLIKKNNYSWQFIFVANLMFAFPWRLTSLCLFLWV